MVEFGEQLRRAREKKGITQQSLAEQLSVARQTISHWECGDRYPDLVTTEKISQILEISIEDLLAEKDMTKVAERNPVIENKMINSLMIVLYTVVIVELIFMPYERFMGINTKSVVDLLFSEKQELYYYIGRVGAVIQVAGFLYCLINAVRENLVPKKIGVGWGVFFISNFVIHCSYFIGVFSGNADLQLAAITFIDCLLNLIGVIASVFFFIKKSNAKIWGVILGIISLLGFFGDIIIAFWQNILERIQHNSYYIFQVDDCLMKTALYALIIYQAYVLYRKRRVVAEITEEK